MNYDANHKALSQLDEKLNFELANCCLATWLHRKPQNQARPTTAGKVQRRTLHAYIFLTYEVSTKQLHLW
jgi:hypothetical protein